MRSIEDILEERLVSRRERGLLRRLAPPAASRSSSLQNDFASNDYLGLSRDEQVRQRTATLYAAAVSGSSGAPNGATGSRLLTGDSAAAQQLEKYLAQVHGSEAALVFPSGFACNVGLFSSICRPQQDWLVLDERAHASMIDGGRLSRAREVVTFRHNSLPDLEQQLRRLTASRRPNDDSVAVVGVESCYSMDGDLLADAAHLLDACWRYQAYVVVDEAHSVGLHGPQGRGLLHAHRHHSALLARVITFGKAVGQHGAALLGSQRLVDFALNYARPLIYSTALPLHALCAIRASYELLLSAEGDRRRTTWAQRVRYFVQLARQLATDDGPALEFLLNDSSPVQAVVVPGNEACTRLAALLNEHGFATFPIRSPTVPPGRERLRVVIHAHNTESSIGRFLECVLREMRQARQEQPIKTMVQRGEDTLQAMPLRTRL